MCEVAQRASQILRLLIWTVPGDFAYDLLGRWFRAQQRHGLVGGVAAAGFVVNVLTNLALHRFSAGSGFVSFGPVLGLFLQNTLLACLLLGGVARMKLVKVPPLAVLSSSSAMLYTGISSMLWTCAELWAWEAQVFEADQLGFGRAASYALLSSIYSLLIMIPVGGSFALNALAGEALGKGDVVQSRRVTELGLAVACSSAVIYGAAVVLARRSVASIVCGGVHQVEADVIEALPVLMGMQVLDALFNNLKAWLILRKYQLSGAVMSVGIYYLFGLPLGFFLAFHRSYGVTGLWLGLAAALSLGVLISAALVIRDFRDLARSYTSLDLH